MDLSSELKTFLDALRRSRPAEAAELPAARAASAAPRALHENFAAPSGPNNTALAPSSAPPPPNPALSDPAPLPDPAQQIPFTHNLVEPGFTLPSPDDSNQGNEGSAHAPRRAHHPQNLLGQNSIAPDGSFDGASTEHAASAATRPEFYSDAAAIRERFELAGAHDDNESATSAPSTNAGPGLADSKSDLIEVSRRLDEAATKIQKAFATARTIALLRD